MNKTTVVNYHTDDYDVCICRPSKWGNPFVIGRDGDRVAVVAKHRAWLMQQPALLADLPELRGLRLGCCCAPAICHGDVLAELADIPTGPAVWRSETGEVPIDVTGVKGVGEDGRLCLRTVW